ncbi:MAG: hypothetical protein JWQ38_2347 [Flavipsychrobacter sp.]|nr:hypothetical protein [Flavipsychrobacter sp.]
MNTNQLNYLNIGLMILSCVIAFIMPFELFLFSYAVLGPLHYLTEISWLHKRQYFSPGKRDFLLLGGFALVITLGSVFPYTYNVLGPKDANGQTIFSEDLISFILALQHSVPALVFAAFAGSALMILAKDVKKRAIGFALIAVIAYMFHSGRIAFFAFAVFLPTLVHVFLFTGVFILVGTLKSRSLSGVLSLIVFIACAISLFIFFPGTITPPGEFAAKNYDASFYQYNQQIFDALLHKKADRDMIYNSSAGIMITRFIAFAYTYHYLNWFSKTSVIKWHMIPRRSLIIIGGIWLFSLALYLMDYITGLMALYFLSYLHVVFEFPLNFRSFKDVGTHLRSFAQPKTS